MPTKKAPIRRRPAKKKKLSKVIRGSKPIKGELKTTQSNRVTIPKGLKHVLINPADPLGLTIQHFLKALFGPEPLLFVQQKQLELDLINLGLIPKPSPKIDSFIDIRKVEDEIETVKRLLQGAKEDAESVLKKIPESIQNKLGAAKKPSPLDTTWQIISSMEYHSHEEQNRIIATLLKMTLDRRERLVKTKDNEIRYNSGRLTEERQNLDELNRIILGDHEVHAYNLLTASPAGSNQADELKSNRRE
jgi:hypothetical protein